MSYFIPIRVWGFKQSSIDFICAIGRCVKFIVPINISQMCVYKQIVRFAYKSLFYIHIKNYIFNYKIFLFHYKYFISFHNTHSITHQNQSNKHTNKPSMVCGRRVLGATKHRLHPIIYIYN